MVSTENVDMVVKAPKTSTQHQRCRFIHDVQIAR